MLLGIAPKLANATNSDISYGTIHTTQPVKQSAGSAHASANANSASESKRESFPGLTLSPVKNDSDESDTAYEFGDEEVITFDGDVSAPARDGKLVLEMTSKRKKQKKRQIFDPSLGVTQFPRAWSEASTIASNRKRAKELKELIDASHQERQHLLSEISVEEGRNAGEHNKGHGHGKNPCNLPCSPKYQLQWIISTIFIFIIRFVFCVVFALLIHEAHPSFHSTVGIGIHIQLISCVITCLSTAIFSKIGVSIGGPDIIAAIFTAGMAATIGKQTDIQPEQNLPTLLFLIFLTTFLTSIAWIIIGFAKATSIVEYMPVTVQSGFLGCIGYKVIYYAFALSTGAKLKITGLDKLGYKVQKWKFWATLLVALPLGFGLYYFKKFHRQIRTPPTLILPAFLILSFGAFSNYCLLFVSTHIVIAYIVAQAVLGYESMYEKGWMFPAVNHTSPEEQWTNLLTNMDKIHWEAVGESVPNVLISVLMVTVDVTIKIRSTKRQTERPMVDANYEMKLAGIQNVVTAFAIGAPGYSQVKFNVLNYHIIHNSKDRKPGIVTGVVCGFLFFFSLSDEMMKILPRPIIGMLLIYAGLPFVEEHLIFSYNRVCKKEFAAIWAMVLTNAILGFLGEDLSLLFAFLVGVVLSLLIFMLQYYRTRAIREIRDGESFQSSVLRPYVEQKLLENLGCRMRIIVLQGFLFFVSATAALTAVKKLGTDNKETSFAQRARYIILDFHHVRSADHSSMGQLKAMKMVADSFEITLIFSGLNQKLQRIFASQDLIAPLKPKRKRCGALEESPEYISTFENLDYASEHVEELLLERAANMRSLWLQFASFKSLRSHALIKATAELLEPVIDHTTIGDKPVEIWKFATLKKLEKGELLCRQQTHDRTLYVVQEGILTSYADLPDGTVHRLQKMSRGTFINDECLFVDLPVAYNVKAELLSYVWAFSQDSIELMQSEQPWLALEIVRRALRHTVAQATVQRLENIEHDACVSDSAEFNKTHNNAKNGRRTTATLSSNIKRSVLSKVCWDSDYHAHRRKNTLTSESASLYQHTPVPNADDPNTLHRKMSVQMNRVTDHHNHSFIVPKIAKKTSINRDKPKTPAAHAAAQPHLSNPARIEAEHCFQFLATAATPGSPERRKVPGGMTEFRTPGAIMPPRVSLKIASSNSLITINADEIGDEADSTEAVPLPPPSTLMIQKTLEAVDSAESPDACANAHDPKPKPGICIPIDQVDKAMFPLNLFPSREELQNMHEKYDTKNKNYVTLPEFIEMVEHLTFADIDENTRLILFNMYKERCQYRDGLTREGLQDLLLSLDDQHTFEELDQLMQDWDVTGTGRLTFDAFLSIVAMDIKQEEKERAFEKDYERFCPKFARDADIEDDELQRITVKSLVGVFQKLEVPITEHIAEEMIFDADLSKWGGSVSYDDLIATITIFQSEEIYDALNKGRSSKSKRNQNKTSIYKSMTHRYN